MNFPAVPGSTQSHIVPHGTPLPKAKSGFGAAVANRSRWDDGIKWGELVDKQWTHLRFYGDVYLLATSWIKHQKSGKKFPILSLAWDPETKQFSKPGDPILDDFDPKNSPIQDIKDIVPRQHGFGHAIFRQAQQMGQPCNLPVKLPISLCLSLQRLSGMNKHVIEGSTYEADVTDPYWGADVYVFYDSSARAEAKYQVQIGPRGPLRDDERAFVDQQINWRALVTYPTREEVVRALRDNGYYDLIGGGQTAAGQMIPPAPPIPSAAGAFVPPPPSAPHTAFTPPLSQTPSFPSAPSVGMAPPSPQQFIPPTAPSAPVQAMPPQPFAAPTLPQAPAPTPMPPAPVPPSPAGFAPPPPPPAAGGFGGLAQSGVVEIDEIPFRDAAVTAAPKASTPPTAQQPLVVDAPNVNAAPAAASTSERLFQVVGKGKIGQAEFQGMVEIYAETHKRGPVQQWTRGDANGLQVLSCYSQYRGDTTCMKCPLRRYCIEG